MENRVSYLFGRRKLSEMATRNQLVISVVSARKAIAQMFHVIGFTVASHADALWERHAMFFPSGRKIA